MPASPKIGSVITRSSREETRNAATMDNSRTIAAISAYSLSLARNNPRSDTITIVPALWPPTDRLRYNVRESALNSAASSGQAGIGVPGGTPGRRYSAKSVHSLSYRQAVTIWLSARSALSTFCADLGSLQIRESAVLAPKVSARVDSSLLISARMLARSYSANPRHAKASARQLVARLTTVNLRRMEVFCRNTLFPSGLINHCFRNGQ